MITDFNPPKIKNDSAGIFSPLDCWEYEEALQEGWRGKVEYPPIGLSITPLGGLHSIGGPNCWAIEYEAQQILLDCGKKISENGDRVENEASPYTYPAFNKIAPSRLLGVFLTHGHYDHLAALPHLLSTTKRHGVVLKVWGTSVTVEIARHLLSNAYADQFFGFDWEKWIEFNVITEEDSAEGIRVGNFLIVPFPVYHSIPQAVGFLVMVSGPRAVCYPGDFKYLKTNEEDLERTSRIFRLIGTNLVDVLILDSTNVDMEGYTPPLSTALKEFEKIFAHPDMKNRKIYISTFSSNGEFIEDVATLAARHFSRPVMYKGTTMLSFSTFFGLHKIQPSVSLAPPVIFITGCQGEPQAALTKLAYGTDWELTPNDVVIIAAREIPSNQHRIREMISLLRQKVYKVITSAENDKIHVSGHGSRQDLIQAVGDFCPRIVVPAHGGKENLLKLANAIKCTPYPRQPFVRIIREGETLTV